MPTTTSHRRSGLLRAAAATVAAAAAAMAQPNTGLYAYTGFEDQAGAGINKTSLYHVDGLGGDVTFVADFDDASVVTKPTGDTCLAGQAAKMAVGRGVVFGTPGLDDAPLVAHNVKTGETFCDDGLENIWGLVAVPTAHHSDGGGGGGLDLDDDDAGLNATFAAFSSSTTPALGQWSFEVLAVTLNSDPAGPAAAATTQLSFDNTDKRHESAQFSACAALDTSLQDRVAVDAARHALYVLCPGLLVAVDTKDPAQWRVAATTNLTVADGLFITHLLGYSRAQDALVVVAVNVTDNKQRQGKDEGKEKREVLVGFAAPHTGVVAPHAVSVRVAAASFAYDGDGDLVYLFDDAAACKQRFQRGTHEDSATASSSSSSAAAGCIYTVSLGAVGYVSNAVAPNVPLGVANLVYVTSEDAAPAPSPAGKHPCGHYCASDADCDPAGACHHCETMILHQCVTG